MNLRHGSALAPLLVVLAAGGCGAIVSIDRAVLAYDRTTSDSVSKLLLLNVARARQNLPMHFTGISSIAATYRFAFSAGVGPSQVSNVVLPSVGGSIEENPTISIAPMQGDEFTQRLLTPFQEQKLTLLLGQGYDVDALLRLMGAEFRETVEGGEKVVAYPNRPSDKRGYEKYRQLMAHLSSIQDRHALHVEPLNFQHTWTVPEADVSPASFTSTYKDFSLVHDVAKKVYVASKRVNGRVVITNYDPSVLSNDELFRLHEEAEAAPASDILVDIRAGHPGGEIPLHGRLRLRSFHEVLTFVGRGIEEEREYAVAPDPRTPAIGENPVRALEIAESKRTPKGAGLVVTLDGMHYAVAPQAGYQWNKKAFSLLSQLFQMSVSAVPQAGPAITIAK